jgi:uncharacterized Zn finger protein
MKIKIKLYTLNNRENQAFLERVIETLDFCYTFDKKDEYIYKYKSIQENPRFDKDKAKRNEVSLCNRGIYDFMLDLIRIHKYMHQFSRLKASETAYEPYENIEFTYCRDEKVTCDFFAEINRVFISLSQRGNIIDFEITDHNNTEKYVFSLLI